MAELNCVMYREGGTGAPELDSELLRTGHIRIAACVENYRDLVNAIEAHRPELLVAILGDESETSLESLSALGDLPCSLVCSGSSSQGDLILRSMRLGAAEYLPFEHDEEELMNLVERLTLVPAVHAAAVQPTRASLVTVLGVKGGAGSTVVSSQLAASLCECDRRATAVDLDLLGGSLALHYNLQPRYSIADLAREDEIDASFLRSVVGVHRSGVQVLSAPADPAHCEQVQPQHIETIFNLLRSECDFIVEDLGKRWDPIAIHAMQAADLIVLVMSLDLPTLAATVRTLTLLEGLEIPRQRIRLVANRHDSAQKALETDAESFLGSTVDFRLPNDYATVTECINSGDSFQASRPDSPITAAYAELSREVHDWLGIEKPAIRVDTSSFKSRVRAWFTKANS